jgi:hypothetical protein
VKDQSIKTEAVGCVAALLNDTPACSPQKKKLGLNHFRVLTIAYLADADGDISVINEVGSAAYAGTTQNT